MSAQQQRLKIVRVVTADFVVKWHLHNTLIRLAREYEVCVIGNGVSSLVGVYPGVEFIDLDIRRKSSPVADFVALLVLQRLLSRIKPQIVHSIMPKAGLLAAIAGFCCRVPIRVHTFTGQTWSGRKGLGRFAYWTADYLINALNTVCLTDSHSQSKYLQKHEISDGDKPLRALEHGSLSGVDLSRFDPVLHHARGIRLRLDLGLTSKNFVYAYIARKTRDKGAIDMLIAFAMVSRKLKHARLLFVGPDEDGEIAKYKTGHPELFNSVLDIGSVTDHEIYLAASDVLCLPSHREGFGTIVIEAAAMGVPTIGTRISGLTDSVVDGQTGLLFNPGNCHVFARGMMDLESKPFFCKQLGLNARHRVETEFSADVLYRALSKLYGAEFDKLKK